MRRVSKICFLETLSLVAAVLVCGHVRAADSIASSNKQAQSGIFGHWRLDDGQGGIAKDFSGNGHDGKIARPNWVVANGSKELLFIPRTKSSVVVPVEPLDKELSMGAWFFTVSKNTQSIVQRGDWQNRILIEDGKLGATLHLKIKGGKTVFVSAKGSNYLSRWVCAVLVYDGRKVRFYVDGKLEDEVVAEGGLGSGTTAGNPDAQGGVWPAKRLFIGAEDDHFYFDGFIGDVRLYRCALTEEEVKRQYAEGSWRKSGEAECKSMVRKYSSFDVALDKQPVFFAEDLPRNIGRTLFIRSALAEKKELLLKLEATVSDYYGNIIHDIKERKTLVLEPGKKESLRVEIPFPGKLGVYYLKGTLSEEKGACTVPVSGSFAVIEKPLDLTYKQKLKSPFGIIVGEFSRDVPASVNMLKAAGIRWVQIYTAFYWPAIERVKGQYDFSNADKLCDYFAGEGLMCVASLNQKNNLYENPLDPEAFGNFCYAVARHFKGRILAWNVWGEPHNNAFGPIYDGRAIAVGAWVEKYLPFSRMASEKIKEADPQALVISGAQDESRALEALLAGGIGNWSDVIGVEPYCWSPPSQGLPERDGKPAVTIYDDGKELKELLKKYAPKTRIEKAAWLPTLIRKWVAEKKPLPRMWNMEVGWTVNEESRAAEAEQTPSMQVTAKQQAALLVREYVISLAAGIEKIFFFMFGAQDSSAWAIVDGQFNPRPAYAAYAAMSRILEGAEFKKRLNIIPNLRGYVFEKGNEEIIVLWSITDKADTAIKLPVSLKDINLVDIMGNRIEAQEGSMVVPFTPRPVYLRGKKEVVAGLCRFFEGAKFD